MSGSPEAFFEVRGASKWYRNRTGILASLLGDHEYVKAVDGVSFDIDEGEIVGLAGQSGCGKSTLGDLLLGLETLTSGDIRVRGEDLSTFGSTEMKRFRQECQVIFQDPYAALNPRFTVARTVAEPLLLHGIGDREERDARMMSALEDAGLRPASSFVDKLPSELSGGERQRVCIAQALVLDPDFLVADEPLSMLDVSVRTGILQLFERLQEERDLTMLYISHDLSTIGYLTDRTMIMFLGTLVEVGSTERVIKEPAHPYTEALLDAVLDPDPEVERTETDLEEEVPDPINLPDGCRFSPWCEYAQDDCRVNEPDLEPIEERHEAACYYPVTDS